MPTAYSPLLGLALPVTGELAGTWGDTVNNYITTYLDSSVAGTQTISGSQTAVTLSVTNGTTLTQVGSGATGSAQYNIINCTGNPASLLTITAPAQSKTYLIINATSTSQSVKIVGAGPTTGVTLIAGERALVAWNGSDFIKVATTAAAGGSNTQVQYNNNGVLAGSANMTFNGTRLTVADFADSSLTSGRVTYATTGGNLTDSANLLYSGTDLTVYGVTVGRGAGAVSTNTAVGASALAANTSGAFNTAIGFIAAQANQTGNQNTSVGYGAGKAATAGNITAVGVFAAQATTTGVNNDAFGINALYTNTTGSYNIAVGDSALFSNTTASNNTAVGYQAAYGNTTGTNNTALGYQAMYTSTDTSYNVAIGRLALYSQTTGGNLINVAVGNAAMSSNTVGYYNVAVGGSALGSNTTAVNNTAIGYQALVNSTTASNNTAVGYQAGFSNTTANSSTFVGYQSGYNSTGTVNNFFGTSAGLSITSGSKNTIIGSYNGNQGGLDIRTASNYIVLSDGDGNPRGIFDNNGNLLVGQTAAGAANSNSICINGPASGGSVVVNHASGSASGSGYEYYAYNGSVIGSITQNGTAGVLYNITSDYRLKNVVGAVTGAGERIDALLPVDYTWKADNAAARGFLAHEFQAVYPNSVTGTKDAVDAEGSPVYQQMQASTTEVIADLVAEIKSLRARVAQLEAK